MSKCNDSWTSKDKALHFGVCFVLAALNPFIAILAAMGKELYDMGKEGNHFCWKDVVGGYSRDCRGECGAWAGAYADILRHTIHAIVLLRERYFGVAPCFFL